MIIGLFLLLFQNCTNKVLEEQYKGPIIICIQMIVSPFLEKVFYFQHFVLFQPFVFSTFFFFFFRKQKSVQKQQEKEMKSASRLLKQQERVELKERKKKEQAALKIVKQKERLEKK